MNRNDLFEICDRLEGFADVFSAKKTENGTWELSIEVCEVTPAAGYDICHKLNGWNKDDYFSIIRIETDEGNRFIVETKRVKNEESN